MTMTKAKFMIVTPTNPKKSSLMMANNIVSTIAPPPLLISQQIAVEQVCIHQRVKGGNQLCLLRIDPISLLLVTSFDVLRGLYSAYSHFLCFTLYNTSE